MSENPSEELVRHDFSGRENLLEELVKRRNSFCSAPDRVFRFLGSLLPSWQRAACASDISSDSERARRQPAYPWISHDCELEAFDTSSADGARAQNSVG